jgi:hypothetical protein
MKDKNLNPVSLIITGVALVLLAILLVQAAHRKAPFVPTPPPDTTTTASMPTDSTGSVTSAAPAQPVSVCYASTSANKASLKLTTSDGQTATGTLSVALAGKDVSNGTLSGTLTSNSGGTSAVFNGTYTNNQEGMNNANEQIIQLNQNSANIGYGEMVASPTGGYIYKDKSAINYSLSLPRVTCTQ